MNGFLTRSLIASLLLAGLALPVFAQNTPDNATDVPAPHASGASFLPAGSDTSGIFDTSGVDFSGLAAPVPSPAPATPTAAPNPAPDLTQAPVVAKPLPNVSPEAIGIASADNLGANMWQGTDRAMAEHLLAMASPTLSPELNLLTQKLLLTAATPPEGDSDALHLTSERVEKLAAFGSGAAAWALAAHTDSKLVDDASFHLAAASALASNGGGADEICAKIPDIAKTRITVDWQKILIVCQLRAKDAKAAQVSLDIFRTQSGRDTAFIDIADKDILGGGKTLPVQLTPLSPETVALLQMAALPLPDDVYAHADPTLAAGLLQVPPQQDIARLALAERALERGMISDVNLEAAYRATNFSAASLAAPLAASESGLRLRALLFRAADGEKDTGKRMALAAKFIQSASPAFLNNAGAVAAAMLGDIKADANFTGNAVTAAEIYMLAGKNDLAADWLHLAQGGLSDSSAGILPLWPQFALAGLESDGNFNGDFDKWLASSLKNADPAAVRDVTGATMLLMEAAGIKIPDAAWDKVLAAPHSERRVAISPLFCERMLAASNAGRRAEVILLAVAAAGDSDIPLPVALDITRALRQAGFKNEAATFAREQVALLAKAN